MTQLAKVRGEHTVVRGPGLFRLAIVFVVGIGGAAVLGFLFTSTPLPHDPDPGRHAHYHRRRPLPGEFRNAIDAINGQAGAR